MLSLRQTLAYSLALMLALPSPAFSEPPATQRVNTSFIGMGAATGTPSGDVAAAVKPILRSLGMPPAVRSVQLIPGDLYLIPVTANFPRSMRIGVQASLGSGRRAPWLRFTMEELIYVLGERNVEILWLDSRSLELGVQSRQLDFVLMDADRFALLQAESGIEPIASFLPNAASRAEDAQAAAVFTRRMRTPSGFMAMADPSASIAALVPDSLAGWLAALGQISQAGSSPAKAEMQTTFYGDSSESVVRAVLSGSQNFGVLPACELETLERRGVLNIERDISIVSPVTKDTLSCLHSTVTYPSLTFGAAANLDPAWRKAVSTVLYAASSQKFGGEWALPAVNRTVYDLFYELKLGPYEHLGSWSFNRFLKENAEIIALFFLLAFLLISYAVSLSVLVRRKTAQLRRALEEREVIEAEAVQSRQHIANLERTGIVGQMSTIIAHELKQPLAAISNFASSLSRRTQKGNYDEKAFAWALGEIIAQAERANEIVNRVRAYAKHDYPPRTLTDLADVIQNAITTFRRARRTDAEVIVRVNRNSMGEVDAWEIELAVLNLMKNAADAISGVENPKIIVELVPVDETHWALSVEDNGPYITDEAFDNLFKPLQTTKGSAGMGLGLSIIANIAERHAGRAEVKRAGAVGLRFTLILPRSAQPERRELADDGLPPRLTVYGTESPEAGEGAADGKKAAGINDPASTYVQGL